MFLTPVVTPGMGGRAGQGALMPGGCWSRCPSPQGWVIPATPTTPGSRTPPGLSEGTSQPRPLALPTWGSWTAYGSCPHAEGSSTINVGLAGGVHTSMGNEACRNTACAHGERAGQHVPGGVCAHTCRCASLAAGVVVLVCAGRACAPANMWFVFRVCVWWCFVNEVHSAMCVFILARRGWWCCVPWPAARCLYNGACVQQRGDARACARRPCVCAPSRSKVCLLRGRPAAGPILILEIHLGLKTIFPM